MTWDFAQGLWVCEGVLDNMHPRFTRGNIYLAGIGPMELNLRGDMDGCLKGRRMRFYNHAYDPTHTQEDPKGVPVSPKKALSYLERYQVGAVYRIRLDDILHIEWCSRDNGYCTITLPILGVYVHGSS